MRFFIQGYGLFLCLCFLHTVQVSHAQTSEFSFDHLTVEEGLSQSTVLAITQDAEGFMWFGTRDGLNRYDARKITVYRYDSLQPKTISDNSIFCLLTDSRGRLWAGTRAGLDLYDPITDSFRRFKEHPNQPRTLSSNNVTVLFEDRQKNIWIGTHNGLNLLTEDDSLAFFTFKKDDKSKNSIINNDIRSIFQDKDGSIWIGTANGFSQLVYKGPTNYTFQSFVIPGSNDLQLKSNWVNAFEEDAGGRLMIGTERNGLIFFDKISQTFSAQRVNHTTLEAKAVRTLFKDPSGQFWIGTIGGLFIVNDNFSRIKLLKNINDNPTSITDNSIRSFYMDRDGSFWIGTFHGGVNSYSPLSRQFRDVKSESQKIRFKVASALVTDSKNNLWIGTEGSGLIFIDRKNDQTINFKHDERNLNTLSHDNIKCLLLEDNKGIWIGTIKGLDFYDFNKRSFIHFKGDKDDQDLLPDDAIYDLMKDDNGKLWVATYRGGLLKFNPANRSVEEIYTRDLANPKTISSAGVTCLVRDSRQNFWVGTITGLNKKLADGSFERFDRNDPAYISGGYILCIFEDHQQRLWIGTRGSGAYVILENGKIIKHFLKEDGLPGNSVFGIQEDDRGDMWLSTESGLSRCNQKRFTFKNFDRSDGLDCKQFNFNSYHRDNAGYLYFGGYNGIVYFHPDSISENIVKPIVAFTGVRLFNKEISVGDDHQLLSKHANHQQHIELRHDQNIFSVEFAVLNYINPAKNQFAYKLENFEKDWNIVKEPLATYMNLAPGEYTLLVKGSNNDGLWNDAPKTLAITILPPPWKTWWAYCGYVSIFLLLLYTWSRVNKKRARLEHDLQLEHLEKEKQSELHQAKLNFFTNIAHEIRTPVTLIASPLENLLDNHKHDPTLKKELTIVKNNTDRLTRLLNQLLDFQKQETGNMKLRVSQGNIVEFLGEIIYSFSEYAQSRKVTLNFITPKENIPLWYDGDELAKVFFNLLINALKFTPGGGEVTIKVICESGENKATDFASRQPFSVKIIIEDNGLGISSKHLDKIFHRFYQAENSGIQESGFGIGLALTKGIIDLHHGNITVDSREASHEIPGFTRFTILIPGGNSHFKEEEIRHDQVPLTKNDLVGPSSAIQEGEEKNNTAEKPLVLLVEDNDEIRTYMRDILTPHYHILEGRNGIEGWEVAIEKLPNIVISDIMMPRMNGLELVSKLKADQRTSHIPVILLTARGTLNHQVEGLETGADDYLTKPFNTTLLIVKIKNHLKIREKLKEKFSRVVTLEPRHEELEDPEDKFLQKLMNVLDQHITDPDFNVSKLVREIGMSRPVLFRKTKMLTGLSVIDLIKNVRMKKAEMLLKQKKMSISEIAFTVGFSDPKYFSKSFRSQFGKPPSQYLEELE